MWLDEPIPDYLYRNDDYMDGSTFNIVDLMVYEITELGNTDILEYCVDHYDFSEVLKNKINKLIDDIANDDFLCTDDDVKYVESICTDIINGIQDLTRIYVQYGLWLANKETVYEIYDGTPDNISAYHTSDIILSNLGSDGILFGYTELPKKIKKQMY